MQLAGFSAGVKLTGEDRLPGTANYFIGNDPAKLRRIVAMYAKVKYTEVYLGVYLIDYGNRCWRADDTAAPFPDHDT